MPSKRRKVPKSSAESSESVEVKVQPFIASRIPSEILSEIFACTEAIYREEQGPLVLTPWTPVYQLYRVCRSWRHVALDTPELWTCMTIRGMRTMLRAERWLEHAKKRLCTVCVRTNSGKFTSAVALGLLALHMDHIGKMEVDLEMQPRHNRTDWPDVASSLTSLKINGLLETHEYCRILSLTPHLKQLAAKVESPDHSGARSAKLDIRLPQLIHLEFGTVYFPDVDDLLSLLQACPNLRFLRISEGDTDTTATHGRIAAELLDLRAISLPPWSQLSKVLLPRLLAPVLQHILFEDMSCTKMEACFEAGTLDEYRKHFAIDEFQDPSVDDLTFLFRRCPQIEELDVDRWGGSDDLSPLIEALTTPDDDGNFALPNLRRLTLSNAWDWGGSLARFERRYVGVVGVDCHLPRPLESLTVENCWVTGGWNSLGHICNKHGTLFGMSSERMDFKWDRSLLTKEEIRELKGSHSDAMQWDEEWAYDTSDKEDDSAETGDSEEEPYEDGDGSVEEEDAENAVIGDDDSVAGDDGNHLGEGDD